MIIADKKASEAAFRTLRKVFSAGFTTETQVLALDFNDISKISNVSGTDVKMINALKRSMKERKLISFLSGEYMSLQMKSDKEHHKDTS